MMTKSIEMTAACSYLHLKVGLGFPMDKMEEGPIRESAIRFYWSLFQLLNKELHVLQHDHQARVLRLSFEDDFDDDDLEEDDLEEDEDDESGFIPLADFFNDEEDPREEEEEGDLKDEFSNK